MYKKPENQCRVFIDQSPIRLSVCDQAGECDLQSFSLRKIRIKSFIEEEKRTFEPEDIGPNIQLHMNRCILCYRCVMVADQLTDDRVHGSNG
jgi:NADH-quinone oxidoreductase subunit G